MTMLYSESTPSGTRAEQFLRRYRVLEGLLEKAMASKKPSSSFVMDYLHDDDSMPIRYELNMCREIRNLLTHNSDPSGQAVVEPSEAVLSALERVILHVSTPRSAISYGTPAEKIMTASTTDNIEDVMHHMAKLGYSNVPIMDHGHMVGVFGKSSLFAYAERFGFESLND
ncbi:MAG: CBS domain-containing protein, partial [Clostridia bacterium]|nr:CBS domain-containing protein [Clostridia bacterium]